MAADTAVAAPGAAGGAAAGHGPLFRFLFVHEIDEYPDNAKRTAYLALAVLATIVLYYTYFTQTGVTPQILQYYHMSFSFYVGIVVVSNLIGAFASLPASKTDKLGRSNVVIYGLLIVGLLVAVGVPATHDRVAVRHRHLRPRPGRGGHPGGHPGPGPRLQPPAGPGLGHGVLDRRPGGRQPDHLHRGHQHPQPLPAHQRRVRVEEPVRHLRASPRWWSSSSPSSS